MEVKSEHCYHCNISKLCLTILHSRKRELYTVVVIIVHLLKVWKKKLSVAMDKGDAQEIKR